MRLELERVTKVFAGGLRAVDAVSIAVPAGEILALVGPSGSGKTTTLRLIAGLENLSSGRVLVEGRDVSNRPPAERDVALVPQPPAIWPSRTVRENLLFGPKLRRGVWSWRGRDRDLERTALDAARLVGIEAILDRRPADLSAGERQRLAVAKAVLRRPPLLLLDEPLANLDGPARLDLRARLRELPEQLGAAVVHVTHDQGEALAIADQIAVLDQGRLQQVGTPRDVYDRPANRFVAGFIGPAPMNLLGGTIEDKDGRRCFLGRGGSIPLGTASPPRPAGSPIVLGIRPEHVGVVDPSADAAAGRVERFEWLGSETLLHASVGDWDITVLERGPRAWRKGEPLGVRFPPEHLRWFDPTTGAALGARL